MKDHKRSRRIPEIIEGKYESVRILVAFLSDAIVVDQHQ
jgi:hypothetical protein